MSNLKSAYVRGNIPADGIERDQSFSPGRIRTSDEDGTLKRVFLTGGPSLTSDGRPWTGITIEEHHLQPIEFPERTPDRHLIAMPFHPATLEWFLGGHPQTRRRRTEH